MSTMIETAGKAQAVLIRINTIKKELSKGNELYKKHYRIAYEKWAANPNRKRDFNPDKDFVLVAIKERLCKLLREQYRLEEILPEG